jgi:hypothetical protein
MTSCLTDTEYSNPLNIDNKIITNDESIVGIIKNRQNKLNKDSTENVLKSDPDIDDYQLNNNKNEKVIENFSLDIPMTNSIYGLISVTILVSMCCLLKN